MTTFFLINVLALLPLAGLGLWLDRSAEPFEPPREDDHLRTASVDAVVRRLTEDLDNADHDADARPVTYARVVDSLRPAIRRRLAGPLPPPVRQRLEVLARTDAGVRTTAQLDQLLTDLELT